MASFRNLHILSMACIILLISQPTHSQDNDGLIRTASGLPDYSGIWQAMGTAHWNLETHGASAGNFHSENLKVTERFTPVGRNLIIHEATMEDPENFTRPWNIELPLYRRLEENAQLVEFKCMEFSEEILYGHLRANPAANN